MIERPGIASQELTPQTNREVNVAIRRIFCVRSFSPDAWVSHATPNLHVPNRFSAESFVHGKNSRGLKLASSRVLT